MMKHFSAIVLVLLFVGMQSSVSVSAQIRTYAAQTYTSERHANSSSCQLNSYAIELLQTGVFPVYNNGANKNYEIGNARIQLLNNYQFKGRDLYDSDMYGQSQTISFKRVKDVSSILTKLRRKKYSSDLSLTQDLQERGAAIKADKELRRYIRKNCGALFTLGSGNFYRPDPRNELGGQN